MTISPPRTDLAPGHRQGRLLLLSTHTTAGARFWACQCACGNQPVVRAVNLKSGRTKSCGCLRTDVLSARRLHPMSTHPSWRAYNRAVALCGTSVPIGADVSSYDLFWAALGPTWFPGARLTQTKPYEALPGYAPDPATAFTASNLAWK